MLILNYENERKKIMTDEELLESLAGKQKVNVFAGFAPRQSKDSSVNKEYQRSGTALEAQILYEGEQELEEDAKRLRLFLKKYGNPRVVGYELGDAEF